MDRDAIIEVIFEAIALGNQARPDDAQVPQAENTPLYGEEGHLDSMALVSLLMDVEDALLERGHSVSLSDERALSATRSPFRSVATLADYTVDLLKSP